MIQAAEKRGIRGKSAEQREEVIKEGNAKNAEKGGIGAYRHSLTEDT